MPENKDLNPQLSETAHIFVSNLNIIKIPLMNN